MFAEISESNSSSLGVYIPVSRFITECEADTTPKTQCCTCSSQMFCTCSSQMFALGSCKIFFGKGKSVNTSFACGNTSNKTNLGKVSIVLSYLIFYYHSLLLTHITWPISSWVLLGHDSQQKHALPSLYEKAGKSQICRAADSLVPWKCLIPPGDTSIW